jgi:hypothetical protein
MPVGRVYLAPAMTSQYVRTFDRALGIRMVVDFTTRGPEVTDYAVILVCGVCGRGSAAETIRVYDSAHEYNEMHRYTASGGKQSGIAFHSGTLGEGMRDAIEAIRAGHREMIEGLERQ